MSEFEFKNKKLNIQKLLSFGFLEQNDCYTYSFGLSDGQLQLNVIISKDGKVNTKVLDKGSDEEYVLHLVQSASGSFVGQVRNEYDEKIKEISLKCFDLDVFKSKQSKKVIAYIKERYGDELEFLWEKFPDNAVVRRKDNKKWYLALLTVSGCKLGFDSEKTVEILDLRMKPENIEALVDCKKYFPGYHMNKKHWITICLDETVPFDEITGRIDDSYNLAKKDTNLQ